MYASLKGCTDMVDVLLDFNADLKKKTDRGEDAFCLAYQKGQVGVLSLLLESGYDPNSAYKDTQEQYLYLAVKDGRVGLVETLLKHGARIDDKLLNLIDSNTFAWNAIERDRIRELVYAELR